LPPLHLLHIDSSASLGAYGIDPHGSHTRRLTRHVIQRWRALRPEDQVTYRDVSRQPPSPVTEDWIEAAFTPPERRAAAMIARLAESDRMIEELEAADVVVVGAPMYNYGIPSPLKAWIDNVVRVGVTFGFDRERSGGHYWPMLSAGKRLLILSSRGEGGYDDGGPLAPLNLVERQIEAAMAFVGLGEAHRISIEHVDVGDESLLAASVARAEVDIDSLVRRLASAPVP
jgi:FMN-dependent NADH-azoreductase